MNKTEMIDDDTIEIDLRDIFGMLMHRLWLILLVAVVGGLLAFSFTYFLVTPMYTASASMYVTNSEGQNANNAITTGDLNAAQSLVDTYIVILRSDTLLSQVQEELPPNYGYTIDDLGGMLSAQAINGTQAFQVNIVNADPAVAQRIANTVVKVAKIEIKRVIRAGNVEIIDQARLPTKADWPLKRNTAIGLFMGIVLAVAAVILFNVLDVKIRGSEDLTRHYDLPILGVIPSMTPAELVDIAETKDVCA